jgi:hypothetical protein
MLKEMCEAIVVEAVRENKEEIMAAAVKGMRRIPKNVPYIAAGAVAGATIVLGGVYAYNKIKDRQEEKRNKMKEQMREEIIAELNNK